MDKLDWAEATKQASYYIREKIRAARLAWTDVTEVQLLTEEVTNEDPWGPETRTMARIAAAAHAESRDFDRIMLVIMNRLRAGREVGGGKLYRQVHKALVLLDYLLLHGPEQTTSLWKRQLCYLTEMTKFQHKDESGRDVGEIVRKRSSRLCELLSDDSCLTEERQRALKLKEESLVGFGGFSGTEGQASRQGFGSAAASGGRALLRGDSLALPAVDSSTHLFEPSASECSSPHSAIDPYDPTEGDSQWDAASKDSLPLDPSNPYDDEPSDPWTATYLQSLDPNIPGDSGPKLYDPPLRNKRAALRTEVGSPSPTSTPSPISSLEGPEGSIHGLAKNATSTVSSFRLSDDSSSHLHSPKRRHSLALIPPLSDPHEHPSQPSQRISAPWLSHTRTSVGSWNFNKSYCPPEPLPLPGEAKENPDNERTLRPPPHATSSPSDATKPHPPEAPKPPPPPPLIDLNFDEATAPEHENKAADAPFTSSLGNLWGLDVLSGSGVSLLGNGREDPSFADPKEDMHKKSDQVKCNPRGGLTSADDVFGLIAPTIETLREGWDEGGISPRDLVNGGGKGSSSLSSVVQSQPINVSSVSSPVGTGEGKGPRSGGDPFQGLTVHLLQGIGGVTVK